jgi:2-keto-4-pentenoate hydratase
VDLKALAVELTAAYAAKRAIDPPSARYPGFDLSSAYAVEAELAKMRLAGGQQTAGWKVGYVDRTAWSGLGLESVIWAHMYDDTVSYADWNDRTLSISSMLTPKIEPEIVFKLAQTPTSGDPAAVLEATEWIALGFEVVDCVYPGWKCQPADSLAAGGLHAALVVGEPVYIEPENIARLAVELADFTVRLLRNGQLVEEGAGKNVLGSPALCVGELNEAMRRRTGAPLQAGDVIATGGLTVSLPMTAGDTWIASLSGIPPSALTLRVT